LTGGGLLRSSGGWIGLKEFRKAGIRVKGDERILGDSAFVEDVLDLAKEAFEEKYELKGRGYDFDRVVLRVAEVMGMDSDQVTVGQVAANGEGTISVMFLGPSKAWNEHGGHCLPT